MDGGDVASIWQRDQLAAALRRNHSINLFEKTPLDIALSRISTAPESDQDDNQLILL